MDREVAIHVFGWHEGMKWHEDEAKREWPWWGVDEDGALYARCPSFSEDISEAWKVVEKLRVRFPIIHVSPGAPNDRWYCSFYGDPDNKGSALEADTAPLAICLAALKALGVSLPEVDE